MARGNETVRINIQTVSEEEQAFDELNKKVKTLERNLRNVKQESKGQTEEMKQGVGELDQLFEDLGGTIESSFLALAGGVGMIAGIGAQAVQTIQEVRRESASFNIEKTSLLISTGDAGAESVASFDQQLGDLRRTSTRDEDALLRAFAEVRPTFQGDDGLDRAFEVLRQTETGPAALLPDEQSAALRAYIARSARFNPEADLAQLRRQGIAMMPTLGNQANQMESIMEGAEQSAALAFQLGEGPEGAQSAFNASIIASAANTRVNQGSDVTRAANEAILEALQVVEDKDTGQMRYASPAIADMVKREGFGAGLLGLMGGDFSREQMAAAGLQGIDHQEFASAARVLESTRLLFEKGESDLSGVGQSLGGASVDLDIDRRKRENRIAQRAALAGGASFIQRKELLQSDLEAAEIEAYGMTLGLPLSDLPYVGDFLPDLTTSNLNASQTAVRESIPFLGGILRDRRLERERTMGRDGGGIFQEGRGLFASYAASQSVAANAMLGRSDKPQRVEVVSTVKVQVEKPDDLNVQSEVN